MSQRPLQQINGQQLQMFAFNMNQGKQKSQQFLNKKLVSAQLTSNNAFKRNDQKAKSIRQRNYSNLQSSVVGRKFSKSPLEKGKASEPQRINEYGTQSTHPSNTKLTFLNQSDENSIQKLPSMMPSNNSHSGLKVKMSDATANKNLTALNANAKLKNQQNQLQSAWDDLATVGPYQQKTLLSNQHNSISSSNVSQRSQSIVENMRQKQRWRFSKNLLQVDPLNPHVKNKLNNQQAYSRLEIRGTNQMKERQPQQTIPLQAKKQTRKIGLIVNPGFRSETTLIKQTESSQSIFNDSSKEMIKDNQLTKANQNKTSVDNKLNAKTRLMNTIMDTQNSQIVMTAYTSSQNNKTIFDQNLVSAQRSNLTPHKVKRMASGIMHKTTSRQNDQVRCMSSFSMSQRYQQQINNLTTQIDRQSYKKGDMIDEILNKNQQRPKTQDRQSTFKFDSHLSKQGSTNLQRYYKLKETIIAKSQRLQNVDTKMNIQTNPNNFSDISLLTKQKGNMISIVDQTTGKPNTDSKVTMRNFNENQQVSIPLKKQAKDQSNISQVSSLETEGQSQPIFNLKTSENHQFQQNPKSSKHSTKKLEGMKKSRRNIFKRFEHIDSASTRKPNPTKFTTKIGIDQLYPQIQIDSPRNTQAMTKSISNDSIQKKIKKRKSMQKLTSKADKIQIGQSQKHMSRHASKSSHSQKRQQSHDDYSQLQKTRESLDVISQFKNNEANYGLIEYINQSQSPIQKQFFRTEDGQLQQADSDDEYIVMQRQIQQLNTEGRNSISQLTELNNASNFKKSVQPDLEYGLIDENELTKLKVSDDFEINQMGLNSIKKAKKMLANLKFAHRYETQQTFRPLDKDQSKSGTNRQANKNKNIFKLATQMSKQVKNSNVSLNQLLNTLQTAQDNQQVENSDEDNNFTQDELQNIGSVNTATLLNKTNVSIKNLNYSLMKLVTTHQESKIITKATLCPFQITDRQPLYFEVNATGLPQPAKILMRADMDNCNGIPQDVVNLIISKYVHVYVSTQAKNPSEKSCQLELSPPIPKVFNFAHAGNQAQFLSQDGQTILNRDQFDKIYIGVSYDLSKAIIDELKDPLAHLFKPEDVIDDQKILDQLTNLNMQLMVRFPKDKDEIQKKRMGALMKKLKASQGQGSEDLSGDNGEQKLKDINKQLTKYYQEQKSLIFEAEQQRQMKQNQLIRNQSQSPPTRQFNLNHTLIEPNRNNSKSQITNQTSKITKELEEYFQTQSQLISGEKKPQAYEFLSNEVLGHVGYNQLLDMYALQINNELQDQHEIILQSKNEERENNLNKSKSEDLNEDEIDNEEEPNFDNAVYDKYFSTNPISKAKANQNFGPINHIARNAFISSKYRQITGIRSHLNHDITATRIMNSQQKAHMNDIKRRLQSQQWLNKWDEFRVKKSIYVAQALKILKARRKAKNIITLIILSQFVKGIIENYELIKAYNIRRFVELMIAIRMYVRYQRRFKGQFGQQFSQRMRNIVRQNTSFLGCMIRNTAHQRAGKLIEMLLRKTYEKKLIKDKFKQFYFKIQFMQTSIKAFKQKGVIKDHLAVLRILHEFMVLKHFFMSLPVKSKINQRILARLNQGFEQVTQEIRRKKGFEKDDSHTLSEEDGDEILPKLKSHIRIYDQISQIKYKARIVENVQHQYALLLRYMESEQDSSTTQKTLKDFEQIRNTMIETFQRQKEMAKAVIAIEEKLYGVEKEFLIQPIISSKKDKKGEVKELTIKHAYKHLNQILNDVDDEVFVALKNASQLPKISDQDDLFSEMIIDDIEDQVEEQQQTVADKKGKKNQKSKEKSEANIMDLLNNEEHKTRLRNDRKNTIKLIQYYNSKPEKMMLHTAVTNVQNLKRELHSQAFTAFIGKRSYKTFDHERIFILSDDNQGKFEFMDQFKDEVVEKGYDYIGTYQRQYKRNEIFRILFKVLKIHQSMGSTAAEKDNKKAEKGKDNQEDGKTAKKSKNN